MCQPVVYDSLCSITVLPALLHQVPNLPVLLLPREPHLQELIVLAKRQPSQGDFHVGEPRCAWDSLLLNSGLHFPGGKTCFQEATIVTDNIVDATPTEAG